MIVKLWFYFSANFSKCQNVNFSGDPQRPEDLPSEEEDGEGEKGEDGESKDF